MLLALLLCCGRGDPDPGQALSWNENGVARPSEPRGDAVAMLMCHGSMSTILIGCEEVDASLAERTPAPRELCNFQFRGEERAPNLSPIGECPNFRNFRSSPPRSL
jgi:hypothetical protein